MREQVAAMTALTYSDEEIELIILVAIRDLQDLLSEEGLRLIRLSQSTNADPFVTKADLHTTGIAGIRDTKNKCTLFKPGNPGSDVQPPTCQGDGHYLCKSCVHYIDPEVDDAYHSIRSKTTVHEAPRASDNKPK